MLEPPAGGGVGEVGGGASGASGVELVPEAPLDAAPAVLWLRVSGLPAEAALLLFEGELTSYYLGRVLRAELPSTLLERQVAADEWWDGATRVVAPRVALDAGATYSLAAVGVGRLAELRVEAESDAAVPLLARFFPAPASPTGATYAAYCAASAPSGPAPSLAALGTVPFVLEPGAVGASLAPGLDESGLWAERCVHLRSTAATADGSLHVPPRVAGLALSPEPLGPDVGVPAAPSVCEAGEEPLERGCVVVEGDRLRLRSAGEALWLVRGTSDGRAVEAVERLGAAGQLVVAPLVPEAPLALELRAHLEGGGESVGRLEQRTPAARLRVVLNEVLANATGPEPQQEWVELTNDGLAPVELAGWRLRDVGGETALPAYRLEPGAFALVVREDFDGATPYDVPLAPGTALLRVPALGKLGLSNEGEPLTLLTPTGELASSFPAAPKPLAGRSVGRRLPWSPDGDAASFARHADPGASPGAANRLEEAAP